MELLHVVTNQPVLRLAGLIALACSVCGACAQPDATSAVRAYLDPDTPESERVALDTGFVIQPGPSAVYGYCPNCHPSP